MVIGLLFWSPLLTEGRDSVVLIVEIPPPSLAYGECLVNICGRQDYDKFERRILLKFLPEKFIYSTNINKEDGEKQAEKRLREMSASPWGQDS